MTIELIIDIIASIIGFISIGLLVNLNKNLGGKMSGAIRLFIGGIIFMVLAFTWSTFFGHGDFVSAINQIKGNSLSMDHMATASKPLDIHHVFMAIGMIFFIFSAQKFSSLIKND